MGFSINFSRTYYTLDKHIIQPNLKKSVNKIEMRVLLMKTK